MWHVNDPAEPFQGCFDNFQTVWKCDARGGSRGIAMGAVDGWPELRIAASSTEASRIEASSTDTFPPATDFFVRGDSWSVSYPQDQGPFGLNVALRSIKATSTRWVIEATIAIQTNLLDTHPTIDLIAPGRSTQERIETELGDASITTTSAAGKLGSVAVVLGSHDAPYTSNEGSSNAMCLRLFGEFLEKGVIRKARPWLIMDCSEAGISGSDLQGYLRRLQRAPLPLTP